MSATVAITEALLPTPRPVMVLNANDYRVRGLMLRKETERRGRGGLKARARACGTVGARRPATSDELVALLAEIREACDELGIAVVDTIEDARKLLGVPA